MDTINTPNRINGQAHYEVADYGTYRVAINLERVHGEWGWTFDKGVAANTKAAAKKLAKARGAKIVKVAW